MSWHWHNWGRWIDINKDSLSYNYSVQVRECASCGKKQGRKWLA